MDDIKCAYIFSTYIYFISDILIVEKNSLAFRHSFFFFFFFDFSYIIHVLFDMYIICIILTTFE
nr:MAG TPA: hypothetical protein [Caudoviricetes sp.]